MEFVPSDREWAHIKGKGAFRLGLRLYIPLWRPALAPRGDSFLVDPGPGLDQLRHAMVRNIGSIMLNMTTSVLVHTVSDA